MKLKVGFLALSLSTCLVGSLAAQMTATTSTTTTAGATGTSVHTKTKVKHTTTTTRTHVVKKHPKKKVVKKTTTYKIDPPSVEVKVKPH